ncbi:MAG TPA: ABC transporter ATP-binding protein [Candidatus Binataceae bacterium]|jgi:subfamily B ATP-binding cassette protein MsbA|nr:ABC transporter ATP-binding protein [Candidatus Binataceae bacterium]
MDSKAATHSSPLIRFLSFVKPHLRLVVGAALMGVGKFTLPLAFPLAFKYVVDVLLAAPPKLDGINLAIDHGCAALAAMAGLGAGAEDKLAALSIAMLVLYAIQSVASYYRNYWAGVAGNRLIYELQCRLFAHLQALPHSFFDRNPSGAIVSRVLNDVSQAHELVNSALIDVWMDGISLSLVVGVLFALDWRLAVVALCIAPVWVTFMRYFSPRIKAVSHRMQQAAEVISGEVHERVAGAATIKAFSREEYEVGQFRERNRELFARTIDKVRLAARQEMLIQLFTRSMPTVVIWVGAVMVMHGTMTLGTMIAFFSYLGFLYLPLERFAQLSVVVSASLAAIERIFGFLDLKPEITDHPLSRPFVVRKGAVRFEHVCFGYPARNGEPGDQVLKAINLNVAGGSKVALVGRSGAGKTTLANLIPRFYDVSAGRVLIDGKDVRHYTVKALRQSVSLVAQDALLFSASVRDNLLYARPDATDEMLWQALESANLSDFVEQLPDGLDTVIGERGVKISGGQRQRLALARAFLKDSKIVILDEPTSAVDSESENLIHEAMERLMEGRTVFLIAHRLRSAISADMIVVVDKGRVVETGTHADLLRRNGTYAQLFYEQARGLALEGASPRRTLPSSSVERASLRPS